MGEFELRERDGLARIGRLTTPHGPIDTPALLPVVHPDPSRQSVSPDDIRRRFGLRAMITSAYITWRTPPLREIAEEKGIHGLLDFDGPVMTDSGAFQQHAYGHVEVTHEQILAFQRRIGSDIATVLDIFVEPGTSFEEASKGVDTTIERAKAARALHQGLLAVPVQGGRHPDLRNRSALEASQIGDILAVGGVVPLMEQYRFADLARALIAARPALAPECAVHLFGTGHPMTFAFAALFGVDLFDSSAYLKFARRGSLLFPEGTVAIDGVREATCACRLCGKISLMEVAQLEPEERERRIAEHNLLMCATEISVVRQAIRDEALWELAERRAAAHPALQAGLRATVRGVRVFLPTEPESRNSFRVVASTSGLRPSVIRFLARLQQWKVGKSPWRSTPWVSLTPGPLRRLAVIDASGEPIRWEAMTGLGAVPLELTELYPVGCYVGLDEYDDGPAARLPPDAPPPILDSEVEISDPGKDWVSEWTDRHIDAILEWRYGLEGLVALRRSALKGMRSRRTGRLRGIAVDHRSAFVVGNDGVPRPTWYGAGILHEALPFPRARIRVAPDAVEFVREGRSLFSRFVSGGDPTLLPGQSTLLVDDQDTLLAVGKLVLAPPEMGRLRRGVAVKVTAHAKAPVEEITEEPESPIEPPE
ncbi:MAG: tRNA guanosine(15) transglycosylase TgtA [Thermoplasmata archaeon]|nr:tRNA guanosine(15) transglycosylase TgtA [Thermoplasmata archaeon]